MDTIRKNSQLISLFFTVVMFFFVIGIYANTVKTNQKDIEKIEVIMDSHTNGISKALSISSEAQKLSQKSIEYNRKVEAIMLEIKTELASIKTDINWIKSTLREDK
jgi:hypothetical protein